MGRDFARTVAAAPEKIRSQQHSRRLAQPEGSKPARNPVGIKAESQIKRLVALVKKAFAAAVANI
jgi:hypothetical protein